MSTSTAAVMYSQSRRIVVENNKTIVMILRSLALLTSLINIKILGRLRLKDSVYKYLFVITITDAVYSALLFLLGLSASICYDDSPDNLCSPPVYYLFLICYILFSEFITSCLALFNILLECFLTLQRIVIVANKRSKLNSINHKIVCGSLLLFSILIYTPALFLNKIITIEIKESDSNTTRLDYRMIKTSYGKSDAAVTVITVTSLFRIVMATVVLSVINIVAICKFKAYLVRKLQLKEQNKNSLSDDSSISFLEQKNLQENMRKAFREKYRREYLANKNAVLTLIAISFLYILGNLPYSVYYITRKTINLDSSILKIIYFVSQCSLYLLVILKTFVYYTLNRPFRQLCNSLFKRTKAYESSYRN